MGKFVGALDQGTQVPGLLFLTMGTKSRGWTRRNTTRYSPGLAVGFWLSQEELRQNWSEDRSWQPTQPEEERAAGYGNWKRAVEKTFDWVQ